MSDHDREKRGSRLVFVVSPPLAGLIVLALFFVSLLIWRWG